MSGMDDSGVADAFYTVLSVGIVMIAAIAVSGIVLSTTMKQGKDVNDRLAGFDAAGMKKGLYGFYYSVDQARSDFSSADPNDIVLKKLAVESADGSIDFGPQSAPGRAPAGYGCVIWSGYMYIHEDGNYQFTLDSTYSVWAWIDGTLSAYQRSSGDLPASRPFTVKLTRGYHPIKVRYFYADLRLARCKLSYMQGSSMVPVTSLYR